MIPRQALRLYARRRLSTVASPSKSHLEPTHVFNNDHSKATSEILTLGSQYLLPVYARPDFVLSKGEGSYVWDTAGRKYLDFSAGIAVNALGHGDAQIAQVMHEQALTISHTSNVYHNEWAPRLAELLVRLTATEGGLGFSRGDRSESSTPNAKVFFSNSGTEANEGALKIARKVGKDRWEAGNGSCTKTRITSFLGSFHGRSMGALSVTNNAKYQDPFAPLIPGIDVGTLNDYACLETAVNKDTCGVIVEPIQGEGGINTSETEWLVALRKRCDEVGAVLIYDEIQCGLYRTGTLWAHSGLPVSCHPDIITTAKPLANGYPIGAVLLRDSVASTMTAGTHGTTFGGSPLACRIGHHVLTRLSDINFLKSMNEASEHLHARLNYLPGWFPQILEPTVRGRGLIAGLGLKDEKNAGRLVSMARERGVFVLTAGKDAVRLVPSLNVGKEEIDLAVDVLESCLQVM